MKKILSAFLVCLLLVGSMFALASCGEETLSGTYETDGASYKFDGNEFVYTIDATFLTPATSYDGTYKIATDDDGNKTITFTYKVPEGASGLTEGIIAEMNESSIDLPLVKGEKSITIAGVKYTKK